MAAVTSPVRSVWLPSARESGLRLAARIHGNIQKSPIVIIAHGMLSDKSSPRHLLFAAEAVKCGLSVVRFDFAGRGRSDGDWHDLTPNGEMADLLGVVDYLQKRSAQPLAIYGSSLGGWVALRVAGQRPVAAVATWAAVSEFNKITLFNNPKVVSVWQRQGFIDFQGGRLPWQFFVDAGNEPADWARPACPCYLAHGTSDEIVPYESAKACAATISHSYFRTLEGADHRLLDMPRRTALIGDMTKWLAAQLLPQEV